VAVIGLGYVGLPLAAAFAIPSQCVRTNASLHRRVIGFDINGERLQELRQGIDRTNETSREVLEAATLLAFTSDPALLAEADAFVVTVPTPIDTAKRPDLTPLEKASATVGRAIQLRAEWQRANGHACTAPVVIYESTVYPGATEEVCVPILERESGLRFNEGFFCGYSPERINPGDTDHKLATITKVTSGSTPEAAAWVDGFYGSIIRAGTHLAASIQVAEAAKVIENTQRDLNIALVNELAIIFRQVGIDTLDVLEAAGTKWNFLPFRPGLVGGHCIGVDPY
jgi:UDP-N-acetyl-D-galactosamine dehydrogenase